MAGEDAAVNPVDCAFLNNFPIAHKVKVARCLSSGSLRSRDRRDGWVSDALQGLPRPRLTGARPFGVHASHTANRPYRSLRERRLRRAVGCLQTRASRGPRPHPVSIKHKEAPRLRRGGASLCLRSEGDSNPANKLCKDMAANSLCVNGLPLTAKRIKNSHPYTYT